MSKRRKFLVTGIAAGVIAAGGGAAAIAAAGGNANGGDASAGAEAGQKSGADEGDSTVSGSSADQATAAALKITGGGKANSVERDGENGATWEVEVTKPDGKTVDVRLDANYGLVVVEGDGNEG